MIEHCCFRSPFLVAVFTLATGGACLKVEVDVEPVCSRMTATPLEVDVNRDPTGDQRLRSPQSIAALPRGGALLAFSSVREGPATFQAVRYAVVGANGLIDKTCLNDMEIELARNADLPVLAVPPTEDEQAMIAYGTGGLAGVELRVRNVSPSGCLGEGGVGTESFVVRPGAPNISIRTLSAAALGNNRFALVWLEHEGVPPVIQTRLSAAVVNYQEGTWSYVPSAVGETFGPLTLPGDSRGPMMMIRGADSTVALAWFDIRYKAAIVRFAILDDLLNVVVPVRDVGTRSVDTMDMRGFDAAIDLAFDPVGQQYLVAWVLGDATDAPRVFGRMLDTQGRALRSQLSADGQTFRLGSLEHGSETEIAVESLRDGGFLAAWRESQAEGREDTSGLRAIAFDVGGNIRFSNRACDNADFPLNLSQKGDQRRPLLSRLVDDTMLVIFESEDGESADRSGSGIRARPLKPWHLFPVRGNGP